MFCDYLEPELFVNPIEMFEYRKVRAEAKDKIVQSAIVKKTPLDEALTNFP